MLILFQVKSVFTIDLEPLLIMGGFICILHFLSGINVANLRGQYIDTSCLFHKVSLYKEQFGLILWYVFSFGCV